MDLLIWLFKEVFYLSAMASVLVLILLALKTIFRKALSPKWHYYLWIVLILRLLVPFQPPSTLSIYTVFYNAAESANLPIAAAVEPFQNVPQEQENIADDTSTHTAASDPAGIGGGQAQNSTSGGPDHNSGAVRPTQPAFDFIKAAAIIWLGGMLLLSLYTLGINLAFAADVRRRYAPSDNERIERILERCKAALHIERKIPLLMAEKARTPAMYGLLKPKILVSKGNMERLSDTEVYHVFLHELSHFKRKDIAWNWLMTVLQIVYFFNPLIWYAFYKIREDCEIACDEEALKYLRPDERQAYGGTIIKLIRLFSESSFIPVTAGISKNKSSLKRRIIMIGSFKKRQWTGTLLAVLIILAAALAGLTGCSASPNNPANNSPDNTPTATASPDTSVKPSDDAAETADTGNTASPVPSESPKPTPSAAPTAAPQPSDSPSDPISASPAPTAAEASNYFGQWTVSKVLAYGAAGTYSKENAEKLIGESLSFGKNDAAFINDQPTDVPVVFKNPVYKESVITKGDFQTDFNMTFDKLGISADSVTSVVVSVPDAGGCVLLLVDADTMILAAGGTYFELARA